MKLCSDDVPHMMDESFHLFTGIEVDYPGKGVTMTIPIKPIDSWSRGISHRLLLESTLESLHQTVTLEMELDRKLHGDCIGATTIDLCELLLGS
ncbi:unnamed protein product [Protopolystoma xenopodis]|uniref:Uncharacterized protein n=1 Tax=Protopolystoma xenopodis TaxID=117903 RepID=A0A448WNR0_9PLAT|nr:unnamed protein product [Protopolystoma xenopodis]